MNKKPHLLCFLLLYTKETVLELVATMQSDSAFNACVISALKPRRFSSIPFPALKTLYRVRRMSDSAAQVLSVMA